MKQKILEFYPELDKALDRAVWLNFEYRNENKTFVIYDGPDNDFAVSDLETAKEMDMELSFYPIPKSYENLSYERIQTMNKDNDPLVHWEELLGRLATMEGEILKFLLHSKIPVEKLIRNELANRGFDAGNNWVGFEVSKAIWLTGETKEKL